MTSISRGVLWLPWPTAENIPIRSFFSSRGPLTRTSSPCALPARVASSASVSGVRWPAGSFTRVAGEVRRLGDVEHPGQRLPERPRPRRAVGEQEADRLQLDPLVAPIGPVAVEAVRAERCALGDRAERLEPDLPGRRWPPSAPEPAAPPSLPARPPGGETRRRSCHAGRSRRAPPAPRAAADACGARRSGPACRETPPRRRRGAAVRPGRGRPRPPARPGVVTRRRRAPARRLGCRRRPRTPGRIEGRRSRAWGVSRRRGVAASRRPCRPRAPGAGRRSSPSWCTRRRRRRSGSWRPRAGCSRCARRSGS